MKLWTRARQKTGLYRRSSLISIRSSLNRHLNRPLHCHTLDLTKDPELRRANSALAVALQGAGPLVQKRAMARSDLRRLYRSAAFDTSSPRLLDKVWFKTYVYFRTRGREKQRELWEDSFGRPPRTQVRVP